MTILLCLFINYVPQHIVHKRKKEKKDVWNKSKWESQKVLWKQWIFIKRELELTNVFTFISPWEYEVLNDMQLEADEIIALRHFIILKQICDWLQGGIAAGSFCRHILMIQFLRWTSSTSVTHTMFQTHWMISKLIIYESFWRKLLGFSQERFILFNTRFPAVRSVYLILFC